MRQVSLNLGITQPEPEPKKDENRCICSRPEGRFYYLAWWYGYHCPKNNTPECKWYDSDLGISVKRVIE